MSKKAYRVTKITSDSIRKRGQGLGNRLLEAFDELYPNGVSFNEGNTGNESAVWHRVYSCPVLKKLAWLFVSWNWLPAKPVVADWSNYDLRGVMFSDMDLTGVNWRGMNLTDIFVYGCELHGADWSGANVTEGQFYDLRLENVNIDGVMGWDKADAISNVTIKGFDYHPEYLPENRWKPRYLHILVANYRRNN